MSAHDRDTSGNRGCTEGRGGSPGLQRAGGDKRGHTLPSLRAERGVGTLGKLVNDESLYFTAKDSLKKMGKAADQLQEQGPLTVIGLGIQALGAW